MFTGIVEEIGKVQKVQGGAKGRRLEIAATEVLTGLKVGDSVAVNGVCLTVVAVNRDSFQVDVVAETLVKTNLARAHRGDRVNLERALMPSDRLGGHLVQGHVDGLARVLDLQRQETGALLRVELSGELSHFVVPKGSIALDGVSLTVAEVETNNLTVALVPHTLQHTTLGDRRVGDLLNVEVDVVGKYVEKITATRQLQKVNLDENWIRGLGY